MFLCPACGASACTTIHGDEVASRSEWSEAVIANLRAAQELLSEGKTDDAHFRVESAINVIRANVLEAKPT